MQKSISLFLCCLLHYHWLIFEMMRKDNCCVHLSLSFFFFFLMLLNVIIISFSFSQVENCCWASLSWQTFVTLCCYFALFWFDLFAGRRRRRNLILCFVSVCLCLLFLVMPAKDCQTAETKEWKDWRDQCLIFFLIFFINKFFVWWFQ